MKDFTDHLEGLRIEKGLKVKEKIAKQVKEKAKQRKEGEFVEEDDDGPRVYYLDKDKKFIDANRGKLVRVS